MIDRIIAYNKEFVAAKGYEKYVTSKYPDKKLAVLTCMDTRLTELLPVALGLKNGDAKIIKNASKTAVIFFMSVVLQYIYHYKYSIFPTNYNSFVKYFPAFPHSCPSDCIILSQDWM